MKITKHQAFQQFEDTLDDAPMIEVMGMSFFPSRVLYELDPIAYRAGLNEYIDNLIRDGYEVDSDY
jgi:hypothetical protein